MADGIINAAIIYAEEMTGNDAQAAATIRVCGISLLDRLLRQLRRQGIAQAIVYAPRHSEAVRASVTRASKRNQNVIFAATAEALASSVRDSEQETFLVTRANALVDQRIFAALLNHPADHVVASRSGGEVEELPGGGVAAAKASAGDVSGALVFDDLVSRITKDAARIEINELPTYEPGLRRDQPMLFTIVRNANASARISREIIARGQKGALDWPARYLHPPVENFLTRIIAGTVVTPNQLSIFISLVGFVATWLFADGRLGVALALALAVGVLDGVDGKLARSKLMETTLGQAEHLLDKVVEYSWYLALAAHFAPTYGIAVWGLALVIIGFSAAEAIQGEFYRRMTGAQLDDAGNFERAWRMVGGRRNTFMWTFLVFVLAGAAYAGYWLIAIYALVTFFVAQVRFILRLMAYAGGASETIARNIHRTAYL